MAAKRCCFLSAVICFVALGLDAADVGAADPRALVVMVNEASAKFRAVTAANVARAKAKVRKQLTEIGTLVGRGQDWQDYLLWDEQIQELERLETGTVDIWRQVYARVARDTELFEKEIFREYRSALQSLIRCIDAHENPDLEGEFQATLSELAAILNRADECFRSAEAARVSELLTKLHRQQQVPELVKAIRQHAVQPNLIVEIPAKMVASNQQIQEDYTFRQIVRGSLVEGSGTLNARQSFALDAAENAIVVRTGVAGRSNSSSLGFGDGVTVRSLGTLNFRSAADIVVSMEGIASTGFDTTGTLMTRIQGVSTSYRGRAAARASQAVYNRQEADRQAAQQRALADLDRAFNTRLDNLIAPIQLAYRKNFYLPLIRHDMLPQTSSFVSDAERATMQIWFADGVQLAAASEPPWSSVADERVRVAIHESAVNNTSALLAGRVRSLVSVLKGKLFEYIAETAKPSERIDIRFHDEVAVRVMLREGTLELQLIGSEYVIEGSTYPGMEITVRYHLENADSTVLRLAEPPQVAPHVPTGAERPRLGLRGIALRRILANVLEETVAETIDLAEITLPEPFDQFGKLRTQRIALSDGWFLVEALPVGTDGGTTSEPREAGNGAGSRSPQ